MNAVDTNVLVYDYDQHEPVKQAKAIALLARLHSETTPTFLLWQVLGELARRFRSWQDQGRITRANWLINVAWVRGTLPLVMPTPNVFDLALDLSGRHSLSQWDSMLLGACKETGVTTFYTEDMGASTVYDGIQLVNPFV